MIVKPQAVVPGQAEAADRWLYEGGGMGPSSESGLDESLGLAS